ncbi:MAG TPA: glucose-1-phosphate adenylyltransferase [Myxococcota bacterium]|nr:glucose-1-phosphate adenylyltransferase [Myxococcota bacterium]HNZ03827.1 glucose-1-phosphate adenylyltransferase [Myxococcota bacterium]HOD08631.1 glucose-1-phosphate adenylyltransferase [Myxococcota bacterium]HPB51668.1 glucose-1-phosphate adenylyltransferase [Myxococcota bacterium]HQP96687.1 glucose-1-phosphate adenylyltransferase [Myxococcota bacterium]
MDDVIALILGGGQGKRLFPLTLERSKPAVAVAGKYRLIDITLSNCINSGIRKVFVITQFLSASLHHHIMATYRFDAFSRGFVEILAAEQTPNRSAWYQGTADAVRESLRHVKDFNNKAILILSGDHLYRMDYRDMLRQHLENDADLTLAVQPVPRVEAPRMGLLKASPECIVTDFVEKPQEEDVLERFRSPVETNRRHGLEGDDWFLGSMGIYVFKPSVLEELLSDESRMDFGKEVIPAAIHSHKVMAFPFTGHWEDIGTIRSYFDAHMAMVSDNPPFPLYDAGKQIYTRARNLPPAIVMRSKIKNCLFSEGSVVTGAVLRSSIIGVRSIVRPEARLTNVVMLGADYYEGEKTAWPMGTRPASDVPPMGVGMNSNLERVIIDKNARIGSNVIITPKPDGECIQGDNYWVCDGITVIPKNAVIPDGTVI